MRIYIVECDEEKHKYLKLCFGDLENVTLICDDICNFLKNEKVECVVSPANAFGLMDGGYDLALTKWYGEQLQERVQKYILEHYYGEQPVGTSFIIDAGKDEQKFIHTPTMRLPQVIKEEKIIYQCMRTTLMLAIENNIESIAIPMFGGTAGAVSPLKIARMMREAYDQINDIPSEINWDYATKRMFKYLES